MYTLKIKVTKGILAKSKYCGGTLREQKYNCAIAYAIIEVFPKAEVYPTSIRGYKEIIKLPLAAIKFIEKFDYCSPEQRVNLNPVEFEVAIPDSVIEEINIDEIKPFLENHPTLKLQTI